MVFATLLIFTDERLCNTKERKFFHVEFISQ